jgi:hypothetical protein
MCSDKFLFTHFILSNKDQEMFDYFIEPFYYTRQSLSPWQARPIYTYTYTPSSTIRPTRSIFSGLFHDVENHFMNLFDYDRDYPEHEITRMRQSESEAKSKAADDAKAKAEAQAESESQIEESAKEEVKKAEERPMRRVREYFCEKRSTFNGGKVMQEHRERITNPDGQSRTLTRRRIGDQWYESETRIDEEGKVSEKETWHNIGEEEIEGFKGKWYEQFGLKREQEDEDEEDPTPSITDKSQDESGHPIEGEKADDEDA